MRSIDIFEDTMREIELIELMIQRKRNSLTPDEPWIRFIKEQMRKGIETCFSEIGALFLRKINAVTFKGFLLKLVMFILAFTRSLAFFCFFFLSGKKRK